VINMAAGLYIHVPFCLRKCRYCDFISYPYSGAAAGEYLGALKQEMALYGEALANEDKVFSTVFIGGGTPTCLPAEHLSAVLERLQGVFTLLPGCEITVEANPGTVDEHTFKVLKAAGVNRLSLGVQSFDDSLLRALGRVHTAAEAEAAFWAARSAGFDNINLDLIFGIPGQSAAIWGETLRRVARLGPEHVAAYSLQVEEGTPLALSIEKGEISACPEELELLMYWQVIDLLKRTGFVHYEISNFARPGCESRHNLGYWRNHLYLGLGPAAHSNLGGRRFANETSLTRYREHLAGGEFPVAEWENISLEVEMAETLFMGLRLLEGIRLADFQQRFSRKAEEMYSSEISRLAGMGLITLDCGFLRLTKKGLPLANEVFKAFV